MFPFLVKGTDGILQRIWKNDNEAGENLNYISENPMEYVPMEFDKCYIYDTKETSQSNWRKVKIYLEMRGMWLMSITTWTAKDSEDQY